MHLPDDNTDRLIISDFPSYFFLGFIFCFLIATCCVCTSQYSYVKNTALHPTHCCVRCESGPASLWPLPPHSSPRSSLQLTRPPGGKKLSENKNEWPRHLWAVWGVYWRTDGVGMGEGPVDGGWWMVGEGAGGWGVRTGRYLRQWKVRGYEGGQSHTKGRSAMEN